MPDPVLPDLHEQGYKTKLDAAILDTSRRADGRGAVYVFTGSTTLSVSQEGGTVEINSTASTVVTVPANTFPTNAVVEVMAVNTGIVSVTGGTGMTVVCYAKTQPVALAGQWAGGRLRFRSGSQAVFEATV